MLTFDLVGHLGAGGSAVRSGSHIGIAGVPGFSTCTCMISLSMHAFRRGKGVKNAWFPNGCFLPIAIGISVSWDDITGGPVGALLMQRDAGCFFMS